MRFADENPELLALIRRYAAPGRHCLKLGGSFTRMPEHERATFLRELGEDAHAITARELTVLLGRHRRAPPPRRRAPHRSRGPNS